MAKPCRICGEPTDRPDELCGATCFQEIYNEPIEYDDERHPGGIEDDDQTESED